MTETPTAPYKSIAGNCPFDTKPYIVRMPGRDGKEYLTLPGRLLWFQMVCPTWSIETEIIDLVFYPESGKSPYAIFKATILDENGRVRATAHKAETEKDFRDFSEKAESGAVSRALAYCGFGVTHAPDLAEAQPQENRPPQHQQEPRQAEQRQGHAPRASQQSPPQGKPDAEDVDDANRQEAYENFAKEAARLDFDVTVMENGEKVWSFMKIGALIVAATGCAKPSQYKGWLPSVKTCEDAVRNLPGLKERGTANGRGTPPPRPAQTGRTQPPREPARTGSQQGRNYPPGGPRGDELGGTNFDDDIADPFAE